MLDTIELVKPDLDEGKLDIEEFEYRSEVKPTWCPGCGDFGILNATFTAMKQKHLNPKDTVCVSGIGCSSRFPFFVNTYGFHTLHGRTMPVATGIKMANPDLTVLAFGGDGDGFAIGGGHFIHAARRNLNITYVIMDNSVYGLTKGQTSPTSRLGYVTKTSPAGSVDEPLNPLVLALACGATFVARGFSGRPKEVSELIIQGLEHKGFAFIDVFSPCPTFNKVNTFKYYKEEVTALPIDHDVTNKLKAIEQASSPKIVYTGVFYKAAESHSYEEHVLSQRPAVQTDANTLLGKLFAKYS
ncbi:MAG: 2-oxoacid:ferredoxin oxidoreductase subunit beta [Chloroflexota bacterium]|nr:2-oxoacid:ferredoxin oxidoreductase subunit beta [Chloroflexota bacterium]